MPRRPTSRTLPFARALRGRMTTAEELLWRGLRDRRIAGLKFRRQAPVGRYVADFLCASHRLIVELDGPPHDRPEQRARDAARDAWLRNQGFTILRLPNELVIGGGDLPLAAILAEVARIAAPSSDPC